MKQSIPALFKPAVVTTAILGCIILIANTIIGNNHFFELSNGNGGIFLDYFFAFITHFGEEWPWILMFFYLLKFKKKLLPLYFSFITFSTILVQVCKHFILPDALRPIKVITPLSSIHTVKGVDVHSFGSFPSGHTSSAFCLAILVIYLFPKKQVFLLAFFIASLVAYSRVYLAQHFPRDTGAGMLVAAFTAVIAWKIQDIYMQKNSSKSN